MPPAIGAWSGYPSLRDRCATLRAAPFELCDRHALANADFSPVFSDAFDLLERPAKDPRGRPPLDLAVAQLSQPSLGLTNPRLPRIRIRLVVKARDEPPGDAGTIFRGELERP
jgi:hypothetical protein